MSRTVYFAGSPNPTGEQFHQLKPIELPPKLQITHVVGGASHFLIFGIENGKTIMYCWGTSNKDELPGQLEKSEMEGIQICHFFKNEKILYVKAGSDHTLVYTVDNKLFAWGNNDRGQLGIDNRQLSTSEIKQVNFFSGQGVSIKLMSAGGWHSLFYTDKDELYGVGNNYSGQLGVGSATESFHQFQHISYFKEHNLKLQQLSGGCNHSLVLTTDNQLYGFGDAEGGQLGPALVDSRSVRLPVLISHFNDIPLKTLQSGAYHSIVLDTFGTVFPFGSNDHSECGLQPSISNKLNFEPLEELKDKCAEVSSNTFHALALTFDGDFYSWGYSRNGCLDHQEENSDQHGFQEYQTASKMIHAPKVNLARERVWIVTGESSSMIVVQNNMSATTFSMKKAAVLNSFRDCTVIMVQ